MLKRLLLLCLVVSISHTTIAGQLSNFEKEIEKPKPSKRPYQSTTENDNRSQGEDILDDMFGDCATHIFASIVTGICIGAKWLVYDSWANPEDKEVPIDPVSSPAGSFREPKVVSTNEVVVLDKVSGDEAATYSNETDSIGGLGLLDGNLISPRQWGSIAMPIVRIDSHWQYLDSDTDALTYTLEAGYSLFAVCSRMSRYTDRRAREYLNIEQHYGMLRLGESNEMGSFQIGIGIGGYAVEGDRRNTGAALMVPISYNYKDVIGIEFRGAWTTINDNDLNDYDVSISAGYRYVQLRAGYRWLWVRGDGAWLDGPYGGLSLTF